MAYIYDLTDTWNAGGTTFNAIKMNVTDSASASGSKLVTLQTNGTEHFSVTKAGVGYFSGNVGIGTSSPACSLEISSTFDEILRLTSTGSPYASWYTGATRRGYIQAQAGAFNIASDTAIPLIFATNTTERMRIDSAGNVGIGTSSPALPLVVSNAGAGGLEFNHSGGIGSGTYIQSYNRSTVAYIPNTNFALSQTWYSGLARAMDLDSSGNLLVGTTATGGATTNTARVTGGIFSTFNSSPSIPHNTATTVATLPSGDGVYLVTTAMVNSGSPSDYNETAIVSVSQSTATVSTIVNATAMSITMSGLNVQLTQGQGTTQTCSISILRLL